MLAHLRHPPFIKVRTVYTGLLDLRARRVLVHRMYATLAPEFSIALPAPGPLRGRTVYYLRTGLAVEAPLSHLVQGVYGSIVHGRFPFLIYESIFVFFHLFRKNILPLEVILHLILPHEIIIINVDALFHE